MKRQSTVRSRWRATSVTQRDVSHAHGHTGSQKNSTSVTFAPSLGRRLARSLDDSLAPGGDGGAGGGPEAALRGVLVVHPAGVFEGQAVGGGPVLAQHRHHVARLLGD